MTTAQRHTPKLHPPTHSAPQLTLPGQSHTAEGQHDHTGMYVMHFGFRRDLARAAAALGPVRREVAAAALTEPGFPAGSHGISGPASFTGAESAAVWAEALGRPVRYTGADQQAWEETLCRRVPEGKRNDCAARSQH